MHFVLPHYETRAAVFFDSSSGRKQNNTLNTLPESDWVLGTNVVYNETDTREMEFIVNGQDGSNNLKLTGVLCLVDCKPYIAPVDDKPLEEIIHYWSDPASWPDLPNRIPLEGEDVVVKSGRNIVYDMGRSPLYKSVEINGQVTFLQG